MNVNGRLPTGINVVHQVGSVTAIFRSRPTQRGFDAIQPEAGWRHWRRTVLPGHGWHECRIAGKIVLSEIVDALGVVCQELSSEVCVPHTVLSDNVQLLFDDINRPVTLTGRHEIDAQSGNNHLAAALFFPVDGEGKKVVVFEVQHGVELIHQSRFEPSLRILAHLGVGVPSPTGISGQIIVLANGRTTHLHPGLEPLHFGVNGFHDAGDVAAAFRSVDAKGPVFGIADVVEMNAVNVVVAGYFFADGGEIISCLRLFGVHIAICANPSNQCRQLSPHGFAAQPVPFSQWYGYYPGVQLHAAAVAFVNGKCQSVVPWTFSRHA